MIGNATGATPPLMPLIANRPHGPSLHSTSSQHRYCTKWW